MALIKCPACGNMVSANANSCPNCGEPITSKFSGQIDSGTECFSVQGGNRIELSAKTQAEINARTSRLSSEGKTVVNVNTSVPQPFTLGVTVWRNDVTITWNASLGSDNYKSFLYSQAKQYYQARQYGKALEIFNKIHGYLDSDTFANQCSNIVEAQNQANRKAAEEAAQLKASVGIDKSVSEAGMFRYIIGGILLFVGILTLICGAYFLGLLLSVIGAIFIIWNRVQHNTYEKRLAEYKYLKK